MLTKLLRAIGIKVYSKQEVTEQWIEKNTEVYEKIHDAGYEQGYKQGKLDERNMIDEG